MPLGYTPRIPYFSLHLYDKYWKQLKICPNDLDTKHLTAPRPKAVDRSGFPNSPFCVLEKGSKYMHICVGNFDSVVWMTNVVSEANEENRQKDGK